MQLSSRNLWCVLIFLLSTRIATAQILEPFSAVPTEKRELLSKRLDGYVRAYKNREWKTLYGFISAVGRGGIDVQTFVVVMSSNHGEDFAQYPDLQTFTAYRTRKNNDGYDIYGCAGAVREGEPFRGIAEVHAVFEHQDWFFTGWTFRDSSEAACKELLDPNWQPDSPLNWNRPMEEIAHAHH
jgi:hypothetical protein